MSSEQELIDLELMGERLRRDGDELDTEFRRRGAAYLQRLARFDQVLAKLRHENAEERKRWATFEPERLVQGQRTPQQLPRHPGNGGQHAVQESRAG